VFYGREQRAERIRSQPSTLALPFSFSSLVQSLPLITKLELKLRDQGGLRTSCRSRNLEPSSFAVVKDAVFEGEQQSNCSFSYLTKIQYLEPTSQQRQRATCEDIYLTIK
jgi:hypothetical protein